MDASGTFTYDSSLPQARDRIRHTLGDTDPATPLRYDETYDALLALYDEPTATAKLARSLANQFGRLASSVSVPGGPSVSFERVKAWQDTAKTIEAAIPSVLGGAPSYEGSTGERTFGAAKSEYRRGWDDAPESVSGVHTWR